LCPNSCANKIRSSTVSWEQCGSEPSKISIEWVKAPGYTFD
jgi:hypothetical protein